MPLSRPLPTGLDESFSVADAVSRGASPDALRRKELRTPYRGVRTFGPPPDDDLLEACRQYAPRLRTWQYYSHETALELQGVPTPEWPYRSRIHVSTHRPSREPRIDGVVGHRLQTREPAFVAHHDLPVEEVTRAWRQAGTLWDLDDLIAAADFLISGDAPLTTVEQLVDEVAVMGDVRGGLLRRALEEVRVGPRSPRETRLRLLLVRAGLPEPEINWTLRDERGRAVAELDLAYPRWKVSPEYDGRVHAEDAKQFARDADRWDAIRSQGWDHVRILNHHLKRSGAAAIGKVRRALTRAGWRPDL